MKPIEFCIQCNKPMDKVGKYCKTCVKKRLYWANKKYIANHITGKLCFMCNKPLDRKGTRCIKCNNKHTKREIELFHIKKQNKLCIRCKKPITNGKNHCNECRAVINKQQRTWRKKTVKI